MLWGKYHQLLRIKNKYLDLLLLGLVVHLAMLGCTSFLPGDTFLITIKAIAIPLIVIYTPGTMLLGILLLNQTRNVENRFAREKLNELERRLSQILKSGNIVSIILDTSANIVFCNQYLLDLTGYSKKEVLYHNWMELFITKDISENVDEIFATTMNSKNFVKNFDNEIVGKNGTISFISWYNTRLYNEKNEVIGVACLGVDLTERKRIETELNELNNKLGIKNQQYKTLNQELVIAKEKAEESDRLKSAFLANLSHEIRTPMNAILGFTELLRTHDLMASERESYINVVHKSGYHLLSIINDIIEMSRIEAGYTELNSNLVSLNDLFDELLQSLVITIPAVKPIQLKFNKPEKNLTIVVDEVKLRQILINLISNAIKYTEAGSVVFGFQTEGIGMLRFWVEDTGIGIDKKHHKLIFNRFRQVDEELKFARGGFGLGLAISKAYVEMMGGVLDIVSSPGKGSRFSFTIPFVEAEPVVLIGKKSVRSSKPKSGTRDYLLLVEDDDLNFQYFDEIFKNEKYRYIHAVNGLEAVQICEKNPEIKLVLMDIKMPVMNGFDALKLIRQIRPDLPVIAQTAYALAGDKERILQAGFDDYITKPIQKDELLHLLEKYMS
jgi:hypothetical protein